MNDLVIKTCGVCLGAGGTYGPGYLPDGRKINEGMWSSCDQCFMSPAGPGKVVVCDE